ncbi:hypothetical protein FIBSPDRAFT_1048126 [Athelia psychrophila]|uniref:Uncharacterized protein n=1 Tax=Athelia psychrophila TaxID=1759441 RepID=A0A166E7S7_9AGAM|nr:hypothetical protein FIBSPDRAFT_1048126 [Fibularhizoctonia sp. CBS 109695]
MSSTDPTRNQLLHLARLISKASSNGSPLSQHGDTKPEQTLESWLARQAGSTRRITFDHDDSQLAIGVSDEELRHQFQQTAIILYRTRKRLPTHPNYERWTADPQVQTKLDTPMAIHGGDARELFEYLKALKREITSRTQGSDSKQQLEAEEAWDGLKRDLRFEDELAKEGIQTTPESGNTEGSSVYQALTSSTFAPEPGTIPDEPPSPLSYWIDLHHIEGAKADPLGHENGLIPEEPPTPLSHWIDLRPIEDHESLVPDVAPEPTSTFLELYPLDHSAVPEVPPFPAEFTLELHDSTS